MRRWRIEPARRLRRALQLWIQRGFSREIPLASASVAAISAAAIRDIQAHRRRAAGHSRRQGQMRGFHEYECTPPEPRGRHLLWYSTKASRTPRGANETLQYALSTAFEAALDRGLSVLSHEVVPPHNARSGF